jgi:DNA-binding SARP family transcriptional activator
MKMNNVFGYDLQGRTHVFVRTNTPVCSYNPYPGNFSMFINVFCVSAAEFIRWRLNDISMDLETRARRCTLELRLDDALAAHADDAAGPWLLCYRAMHCRIADAAYASALALAERACRLFQNAADREGYARALAEAAIARYHLGQYQHALNELAACPPPESPICAAALAFAAYLNHIGQGELTPAIAAAENGLRVLNGSCDEHSRVAWQIVLHRNLVPAYHFAGNLHAARQSAATAITLAEEHASPGYTLHWALYEAGLLEQRAGAFERALGLLRRARELIERDGPREPLWRWVICAEGQTLRDLGRLDDAAQCYTLGGWGEGDDGPLMLWLLQGRLAEARIATEARLAAAHASASTFEVLNLEVMAALLDSEQAISAAIRDQLPRIADQYAALGFRYHRASVLFHVAALCYALNQEAEGDRALAEALAFGATQGYHNFAWWHPARMRVLLNRALQADIEPEYARQLLEERGLEDAALTLTIRCLGTFEVEIDGQSLPDDRWQTGGAAPQRMQRMLLFLARNRVPQSREAIARYVWANKADAVNLAANFHMTLSGLRRVLEPKLARGAASRFVVTTGQGYQLAPSITVSVDLEQFIAHVRAGQEAAVRGDTDSARTDFTAAERRYVGDFALAKADTAEALTYRRLFCDALRWLAADDLARSDYASCIARAQRLLQHDEWDTAAPALLIRAFLAHGDRRAARRQYQRFLKVHGAPTPEIQQLARTHGL